KVKNDNIIKEIYNKITEFENIDKGWAHHNLDHVVNVANLVEKILVSLKYDKCFIEEAKVAAILNDTGAIEGK
ncbi:MAG: HD domain-containing protein, partial [Clostridium sp.]